MSLNIGVKLGGLKTAPHHIAFQFGHVHAISGKPTHRFIQGGRNIAHLKDKRCYHLARATMCEIWGAGHMQKPGRVMAVIFDIFC